MSTASIQTIPTARSKLAPLLYPTTTLLGAIISSARIVEIIITGTSTLAGRADVIYNILLIFLPHPNPAAAIFLTTTFYLLL